MSDTDPENKTEAEDIVEPVAEAAEPETTASHGGEAPAAEPELDLEALQAEVATAKDEVIRANAEMQNVRRRAEKDVENARGG